MRPRRRDSREGGGATDRPSHSGARFVTFQTNEDRRGSSPPDGDFLQRGGSPYFCHLGNDLSNPLSASSKVRHPSMPPFCASSFHPCFPLSGRCQYLSHGGTGKERNNGHFCILYRRCQRARADGGEPLCPALAAARPLCRGRSLLAAKTVPIVAW